MKLTRKQALVLAFVEKFSALDGSPPSAHEVAEYFGIVQSTAWHYLNALWKRGAIRRRKARGKRAKYLPRGARG